MATVAKKTREHAIDSNGLAGEGLSEAVRRALAPRQSRLARHLLPLALSGSLTTIVGCSALPVTPLADTPASVVVPMSSSAPDERTPAPPEPIATVAALGDRRPEIMAAGPSGPDEPLPPGNTAPLPVAGPPPQTFEADVESEVVGLRLAGSRSWQKLNIQDLDVVVRDPEVRFLPLLRILRILNIEHEYDDTSARFHLRGEPEIHIDLANQTGWIGDRRYDLDLVTGTSDITGRPEIYVAAGNLQKLLPIYLAWDDINYEYKATTNHIFALWKRRDTERSLLFADADLVGMELPALLGTAEPSKTTLSFLEMQWRSRFADGEARDQLSSVGMEPTAWGHLLGGRYKIALANIEADNSSSTNNNVYGESDAWVPNRAEWVYSLPRSEIVVGDSSFGLHDLMFPLTNYSGVRVNGLLGSSENELDNDASARGLHRRFYRPHVFEGFAPVGSEVRLELNGDVIATQRILDETDPITGQGVFRFEDIALPSTSVNNIRAVITTEDGVETEIERDLASAPQLLPPGRIAYVGGFGTSRNSRVWETSGTLLTARALYGLNRRISVGASMAFQNHFYDLSDNLDDDERNLPDQSQHVATEFVATPLSNLTLSGDIAWSLGDDAVTNVDYDGKAMRLSARYFPTDGLQLGSQYFSYSPGYFDGSNRALENKAGYSLDASWRINSDWSLRASAGVVEDIDQPIRVVPTTGVLANFGGVVLRDPKRTADYGQFQVSTGLLPRTHLTLTLDRNHPSWEESRTLTSVRSRTRFRNGINLRMDVSFGDNLTPDTDQEYFQGLTLPGFRRFGEDNRFLTLDKKILPRHRVGLEYRGSDTVERMMATHAFEGARLRLSTKFGWDYEHGDYAWEGWWDYPFNKGGRDRISLVTRFERTDWRADLSVNFVSLFENDRRRVRRLPGDRFNPDRGGVKGRVFVDSNSNGILDDGERGLSDVEVAGQRNLMAHTDEDGRFYLPVSYGSKEMQVALNLDSLPATYSVVHGRQRARIEPGGATEVNLAVAPLVSVSGAILLEVEQPDAEAVATYQRQLADGSPGSTDVQPGAVVVRSIVPVSEPSATLPAVAAATTEPAAATPVPRLDYSVTDAETTAVVGPDAPAADGLVREVLPEGDGVVLRKADAPVGLPSIAARASAIQDAGQAAQALPAETAGYSVAREIGDAAMAGGQTDVSPAAPAPGIDSVARVAAPPPEAATSPAVIDGDAALDRTPGLAALGNGDYTAITSAKGVPNVQRAVYVSAGNRIVLSDARVAPEPAPVTGGVNTDAVALARIVEAPLPGPGDLTPDAGSASTAAVAVARATDGVQPEQLETTPAAGGANVEAVALARVIDAPLRGPVDLSPYAPTGALAVARVIEDPPEPVDVTPDTGRGGTEAITVARVIDVLLPEPPDTTTDFGSAGPVAVTRIVESLPEAPDTTPDAGSANTSAIAVARVIDELLPEPVDVTPDTGSNNTEAVAVARVIDAPLPEPIDMTPDAGSDSTEAVAVARVIDAPLSEPVDMTPDTGSAGTEAVAVARVIDELLPEPVDMTPDAGSAGTEAIAVARVIDAPLPVPVDLTPAAGSAGTEAVAVARVVDAPMPEPVAPETTAAGSASTTAMALARAAGERAGRPDAASLASLQPRADAPTPEQPAPESLLAAAAPAAIGAAAADPVRMSRTNDAARLARNDVTRWTIVAENDVDAVAPERDQAAASTQDDDSDWILITETGPATMPDEAAGSDDDSDWILLTESGPQTAAEPAANAAIPDTVTASERVAQAVKLSRATLLTMSTSLTRDAVAAQPDAAQRANPAVQLAMTRQLETVPSFLAEPEVRLAETPEPRPEPATESEPVLRFSREIAPQPAPSPAPVSQPQRKPTRVELAMARAIEQPPPPRTIVEVSPASGTLAQARSEQTRASGMTLSRTLQPGGGRAVSGVRVIMRDADNKVVADSVTARDGSFYLSNLKPGSYQLELDPRTIPEGFIVLEMSKTIEIREADDFQEIELPPIYAIADLESAER